MAQRPEPRADLATRLHLDPARKADLDSRRGQLTFLSSLELDEASGRIVAEVLTRFAQEHEATIHPPAPGDHDDPLSSTTGKRLKDGSVRMRAISTDTLRSTVYASRNRRRDLVLTRQDIGDDVEQFLGSDEYESVTTYRREVIPALLEALGEDPRADVLDIIAARWCGDASHEFEKIVADADIKAKVWSWS